MREGSAPARTAAMFLTRVKESGLFSHTPEEQKNPRSTLQRIVQLREAR